MLKWLFNFLYRDKLAEIASIQKSLSDSISIAKDAKYFALRNNIVSIPYSDINSQSFKTEISAIWKNDCFQFLLHYTRNEFISELIRGGEAPARNVPGMLKGIEALCIKMQDMTLQTERTAGNEEVQS